MTDEIMAQVAAMNSAIGRVSSLYAKWAQKHNINLFTMKILYELYVLRAGTTVTQRQISEELSIAKQSINNIVITLERDGYIALVPSEKDKREKNIVLTEKGNIYAAEMLVPLLKIESNVLRRMIKEQVDNLIASAITYGDYFELEMSKEEIK
jgi:DNA-binding MarR family transcriptional regulator